MIWQHKLYRKSTKACRPTKSCILRLGERPKAPRAVEKDLQAGVGFERCYEKKKVSCPFGVSFNLDSCRETRSSNLIKLCCCQTPHCIWESVSWLTSLVLAARASLFSPIGKRKGKKDPRAKVFERVPLFSIFNIPSDHSQFNRFFIPQLDLSPKVAILGGKRIQAWLPDTFVLENSKSLTNKKHAKFFKKLLAKLLDTHNWHKFLSLNWMCPITSKHVDWPQAQVQRTL